jgi:hypothetical protein
MYMDDYTPPTESAGDLGPPPRPPTVATETPDVPPPPPRPLVTHERSAAIRRFVERTLDAADTLADRVAEGLGLRRS